jgi:transposase
VSQNIAEKADAAEARTQETRGFMQQVRVAARRKYTPEEKVRIVLEGFRREVAVRDLCRREGLKPGAFYAWTKDFMEAGKERLTRDAIRDATRQEIEQIKRENAELKHLVADLSLEVYRLKKQLFHGWKIATVPAHECCGKSSHPGPGGNHAWAQAAGAGGVGDTQEHLLPMAAGATRTGAGVPLRRGEKAVEPAHS